MTWKDVIIAICAMLLPPIAYVVFLCASMVLAVASGMICWAIGQAFDALLGLRRRA